MAEEIRKGPILWEHCLYGALVMGVKTFAIQKNTEWVIQDNIRGFEEKAIPFDYDFCGAPVDNIAHDITRPVSQEEIKMLYQSGLLEFYKPKQLKKIFPVVLGVNITNSFMQPFFSIDKFVESVDCRFLEERRREISDILKKLELPSEPVELYIAGGYDSYTPRKALFEKALEEGEPTQGE